MRATPGALAFAPFDIGREEQRPPVVAVDAGGGCVSPSAQTVRSGAYEPLSAPLVPPEPAAFPEAEPRS